MKKAYLILLLTFSNYLITFSQSVTYESHDEIISNPERGFYHHTETHSSNYDLLNEETLSSYQQSESITQILRVFYLEDFRESPISEEYLNNIRKDMVTIRKSGIKCIVRFAYTTKSTAPYNDATPEVVQTHISQLKSILRANADIIATMQAGFIGAWGEWYYTDHFANSPGTISVENWEDRRQVVYSLLDALTPDRMLQIRTPGYKMTIFDSQDAIEEADAFANTYTSRLGHHNDCFVASSSDFGTYVNPDLEKPYLNKETLYTPMGGETCALASPYSDCDNSSNELARFHWSYLNRDYNTQVLNEWDSQGCFDEITLKLGYRYELLSGTYSEAVQPGGTFSFDLDLQNIGYANPYNPRKIEVILRNQSTDEKYKIDVDQDLRLWTLGETTSLSFTAGIAESMPEGNYDLLLNLPDAYETLGSDPRYSIQMANTGVWEAETGYNNLLQTVSISSEANQPLFTDGMQFELASLSQEQIEINGSSEIFGSADSKSLLVYWGRQSSDYTRIIERKVNESTFTTIASLPGSEDYYLDTDVDTESTYTYRYRLNTGSQSSAYSDEIALETNEINQLSISVDGDKSDWGSLGLLNSATSGSQAFSSRAYFDAQKLNLLLEGSISDYKIYINSDLDSSTGYQSEEDPLHGTDYMITDGLLYHFSDSEWTETETDVSTSSSGNILEISVNQNELQNLSDNTSISFYTLLNSDQVILSTTDNKASIAYRVIPPDIPTGLTITKSEIAPKSRLLMEWNACNYCDGYILERSADNSNFTEIAQLSASTTDTRDDNLEDETTYYYRLLSFNSLGNSAHSEVASNSTGEEILSISNSKTPQLYPNPTTEKIYFSKAYERVSIYSLSGDRLISKFLVNELDMSHLKNGIYLIRTENNQSTSIVKVIKQ